MITTTSEEYAVSFGFTEEEVFGILERVGLGEEKEQVKHWYDGFILAVIQIFTILGQLLRLSKIMESTAHTG